MRCLFFVAALNLLAQTAAPRLRVLDWNIHEGTHLDAVASTLLAQNADVCLLQEVDQHARRTNDIDISADLGRRLRMYHAFGAAFHELSQSVDAKAAYNGQAILSKLPLENVRVLKFTHQSNFWKPKPFLPNWGMMQRREGGRVALVAEMKHGDRRIVIYNLHLESRNATVRFEQLGEAIADAQRYPKDVTIVLGGDLNSVFHADRYEARVTQAGFSSCLGGERVRTHVIYGMLDWIFVRGGGCTGAQVVRGTGASDHDPLLAEISLLIGQHPVSSK